MPQDYRSYVVSKLERIKKEWKKELNTKEVKIKLKVVNILNR